MPGIDGIETLDRIKKISPDIQILMLTGYGSIPSSVKAMKLGAEDFLEKPVELSALLEKIGSAENKRIVLVEKAREEEVKRIMRNKGW